MENSDYGRVRTGVLRKRAAGGDAEARRELARRGAAPEMDIRQLEYHELRQLVLAWNDGRVPEDRARSRALAERAQAEVQVRFSVDRRRWDWQSQDPEPQPPPNPPWLHPVPGEMYLVEATDQLVALPIRRGSRSSARRFNAVVDRALQGGRRAVDEREAVNDGNS